MCSGLMVVATLKVTMFVIKQEPMQVCSLSPWLGRVASGNDSDLILSCTNEGKWGPGGLLPTGGIVSSQTSRNKLTHGCPV